MIKKKIIWTVIFEKYGESYTKEFSTKEEAKEAEKEYNLKNQIKELENIFRKYFKLDCKEQDRYNKYLFLCVDCGIKLLEFECENDGHRNERGNVIYKYDGITSTFLDGERCEECDKKAYKLFQKMIKKYESSKNTVVVIDVRELTNINNKDKKTLLQIMEIVNFWDK